jgi:hypothetical protein
MTAVVGGMPQGSLGVLGILIGYFIGVSFEQNKGLILK